MVEHTDRLAARAKRLQREGTTPVVVEYQSPRERALDSARRTAVSVVVALLLACIPLLISFLTVRDFGAAALSGLGVGLSVSALTVFLNFAQKAREAMRDDALDGD